MNVIQAFHFEATPNGLEPCVLDEAAFTADTEFFESQLAPLAGHAGRMYREVGRGFIGIKVEEVIRHRVLSETDPLAPFRLDYVVAEEYLSREVPTGLIGSDGLRTELEMVLPTYDPDREIVILASQRGGLLRLYRLASEIGGPPSIGDQGVGGLN